MIDELSFSLEEVDLVQSYYYKTFNSIRSEEIEDFRIMFRAYFGTAWLWHFGGKWNMETNKRYDSFGEICLEEYGGTNFPWMAMNPDIWIACIEQNELRETLGASFTRQINYQKQHLEHVVIPNRTI